MACFDMKTNLPQGEWPWGSPSFKALGPHKIELIYKSIVWGLEVVITDIDALVLREPFAFFKPWPDAGFLTTSDHLGNTTSDGKLEDHRGIHTAFNIGCAHRLPPGALRSTCPPARLLAPRLPAYLPACPPACGATRPRRLVRRIALAGSPLLGLVAPLAGHPTCQVEAPEVSARLARPVVEEFGLVAQRHRQLAPAAAVVASHPQRDVLLDRATTCTISSAPGAPRRGPRGDPRLIWNYEHY